MHLLVVIMLTLCCSDRHIDHFAEAGKYCHLRSNISRVFWPPADFHNPQEYWKLQLLTLLFRGQRKN